MKSCEKLVSHESDYFIYSPSLIAMETFFYIIGTGHFIYQPGYSLYRSAYDSFLLLYVQDGCLDVDFNQMDHTVSTGEFLLIDCYEPHAYKTHQGCECIWIHFDGPTARNYYNLIIENFGHTFSLGDVYPILNEIHHIFETFARNKNINEALLSKHLSDILTGLLLSTPMTDASNKVYRMDEIISFINQNYTTDLSVEDLAKKAMLSPYHFIRVFKKETGYTPHEYIIDIRINTAKYMLKSSQSTIKTICYNTGFSSESTFCATFKKRVGMTPKTYRNHSL